MARRLKQAAGILVLVFVGAQLVQPNRTNPPAVASRAIRAYVTSELAEVLDRSCRDCHSNETVWPAAARIAPLSWVMSRAIAEGRNVVNFSEWATYSPSQQETLLAASCDDATTGKMPGVYTLVRPETKLSHQDITVICSAARRAESRTAMASH